MVAIEQALKTKIQQVRTLPWLPHHLLYQEFALFELSPQRSICSLLTFSARPFLVSITSAAPAPAPTPDNFKGLTAVEFKGKTLYVNATALANAPSLVSPNKRSTLVRRSNICGTSSIDPAPSGPYSQVSDCWVIRDYVNSHDYRFTIPNDINVWAALIAYQTCTFKAQTKNFWATWIGSGDVSDLIRDSINKWQSGGVVGARGSMPCPNEHGISGTRWAIVTQ